ncbi:HNH endonuclease [Rathayibacter sp. VKM Ac-2630]|uniref:HNH endonuclease n=1 Tax=Rathayibacter sp. VKM Ac-2630 TaxID=1938617 RepID=UPI0009823F83|nr:hypothetical protein [Rathayibacter sp. VKM Ac-2630]OOB90721.1 hypothetical protein B0T42_09950 [Rathayibacter sp. VKM Ac-2630]
MTASAVRPAVRALVIDRDSGRCRWCGRQVDRSDYSLQHRRPRAAGGSGRPETNLAGNLAVVCGSGTTKCHGHMESHRTAALARGFLVRQYGPLPADVPLLTASGWIRLDDDGGFQTVTETDAAAFMAEHGYPTHEPRTTGRRRSR